VLNDKQLLDLYLKHGRRTEDVAQIVFEQHNEMIAGRTIRQRLAKAYPGYALKGFSAGKPVPESDKEDTRPIAAGRAEAPDKARRKLDGKRFVFTSAQNNTFVHENFLSALMRFVDKNDAQLVVSRFSYNKNGFQNGQKDDGALWYDERLHDYFIDESCTVANDLVWCGELDILPTAVQPLSGFENYTHGSSGIFPHVKLQMQSLPRMKGDDPRFMYTTGAVTLRNYIQRKAGQKADFHHVFGALYVEIDDNGVWFARQLVADSNGTFYDLTTRYTHDGITEGHNVEALNYGDIHIEKMDMDVESATFADNKESMLEVLNPTFQFIHDLSDFAARNHHNIKDPFFIAEKHFQKNSNVERELDMATAFLKQITRKGRIAVVVESNHDMAYQRWLRDADIRQDPENAEFFHASNARLHKAIKDNDAKFNIYEWALTRKEHLQNVIFLREDDSFVICNDIEAEEVEGRILGGVECGMHGHRGPNGARGNPRAIKKVGRKCNLGHMHSAGIDDGTYVAGVSATLDMGYNKGPSSWSHSHIITYPNGKRTIVTIKQGKWRA